MYNDRWTLPMLKTPRNIRRVKETIIIVLEDELCPCYLVYAQYFSPPVKLMSALIKYN